MEWSEILKSIMAGRNGGIATAKSYMESLSVCMADGTCSAKYLGDVPYSTWEESLKSSGEKLVYHCDDMDVKGGVYMQDGRKFGTRSKKRKEPTPGSIMEFDCILTSTRKDRDRDILESGGAEIDLKMPLLWQHMPFMPIGKLTEVLSQNNKRVMASFAIADVPIARDAVVLVEFGALRISHGFIPTKFDPIESKDKNDPFPGGWHVQQFKVLEGSLVSIPSNEDATITAFSREKLHHPLVKDWAQGIWQKHKAQKQMIPVTIVVKESPTCGCHTKGMPKADSESLSDAMKHCKEVMGHGECPSAAKTMLEKGHGLLGEVSGAEPDADDKGVKKASKKNVAKMKDAAHHIKAAADHGEMPSTCKTMCEKAHSLVKDVIARHDEEPKPGEKPKPGEEPPKDGEKPPKDEEKNANWHATRLIGMLLTGKEVNPGILAELKSVVDEAYDVAKAVSITRLMT